MTHGESNELKPSPAYNHSESLAPTLLRFKRGLGDTDSFALVLVLNTPFSNILLQHELNSALIEP